jgi:hypothetical protein
MKRVTKLERLIRKMIKRDHEFGCGFYADEEWREAYQALAEMAGVGRAWEERQEAKKYKEFHRSLKRDCPERYAEMTKGGWFN